MARPHPLDDLMYPPFRGFPEEGLQFLRRLKRNNNRRWFQARKEEYKELVRFPMECLIASLAQRMADVAPEIEFHPKRSIFRIYRDTRFSKNKTPYKTNIAASFELRGRKSILDSPGLYLGIEPGEIYAGGGLYMPAGPQLKAIRNAMVADPDAWLAIAEDKQFVRRYEGIEGEKLVHAPLGYPKDHPMIEYLRYKQFYAGKVLDESACLTPRFLGTVEKVFRDILPLVRWLARSVS
jgi:uncharacterized protein (TIGR02453 family)